MNVKETEFSNWRILHAYLALWFLLEWRREKVVIPNVSSQMASVDGMIVGAFACDFLLHFVYLLFLRTR